MSPYMSVIMRQQGATQQSASSVNRHSLDVSHRLVGQSLNGFLVTESKQTTQRSHLAHVTVVGAALLL